MANRSFKFLRSNGNGIRLVTFQVKPNGVGTPTIGENPDKILTSVTRSGVGVYVLTLTDAFIALVSSACQVQLATAADTQVQLTAQTVATTKTLTWTILTAGVAADVAANAGNILHFTLLLRDSSGL